MSGGIVTKTWHVSRGWGDDPYAPGCGCAVLGCGYVDQASAGNCEEHGWARGKTIRGGHPSIRCTASLTQTEENQEQGRGG